MMKIYKFVTTVVFLCSASAANASTVLFPTDGDVNFFTDPNFIEAGLSLAIFDDSEAVAPGGIISSSTGLLDIILFDGSFGLPDGGTIDFTGPSPYRAINANDTVFIFANDGSMDNFIIGISADGGATWYADIGYADGAPTSNSVAVAFSTDVGTYVVDVQVVPVPAAVWLFGSGLIGLVAVARRRHS